MSAVDDVKNAWNKPGVNPAYHESQQRRLRREWPVLAQAVEKLASQGEKRPVPTTDAVDWRAIARDLALAEARAADQVEAAMSNPSPPLQTREQIAKAIYLGDRSSGDTTPWTDLDMDEQALYYPSAEAVLFLLWNGADRG